MHTSFWFLPGSMALAGIALSFAMVQLDIVMGDGAVREFGWLYSFGPEGPRAILSAIASSMMTVTGLTFSITMLTLQLAQLDSGLKQSPVIGKGSNEQNYESRKAQYA